MDSSTHLLLHNIFAIISIICSIGFALFIYLEDKTAKFNKYISLLFVTAAIYTVSHLIGVNTSDPLVSQNIFLWNMAIFFIAAFQVHAIYAFTGYSQKSSKFIIATFYGTAILLTVFFIFYKDLLFLPSVPKMYFANYYVPGVLAYVRIVFLYVITIPFTIYMLVYGLKKNTDIKIKRQYIFFLATLIFGHIVAIIPNFLIYNINVDPALGMLFAIVAIIPSLYAAIRYELFSVRIVAKQAIFYSTGVVILGFSITTLNYLDSMVRELFPSFPVWTLPLISSLAAISVGVIVWRNLRQNDIMKSEFVSIVTHKFRTPLTHIKWASENMTKTSMTPDQKDQIKYIVTANEKLVELTDLLVTVSGTDKNELLYRYEIMDLSLVAQETIDTVLNQIDNRKVKLEANLGDDINAKIDTPRIRFIMQTFIENAIHYGGEHPVIQVSCQKEGRYATFKVTDNGIGISSTDRPLLFQKFYRGKEARLADTEGMGIALYLAKDIIHRHGGKIGADSKGPNMGSTFHFSIPIAKR